MNEHEKLDWLLVEKPHEQGTGDIHIIPQNDGATHLEEGWCHCNPAIDPGSNHTRMIYVHGSYDEREVVENLFNALWSHP